MTDHNPHILIVVTSNGKLGDRGEKTGFHWEEMTTPYYIFKDAGFKVELASVKGGEPPYDPGSLKSNESENPASVQRFRKDADAMESLRDTLAAGELEMSDYDAIYFPGGHGTMWDFPYNEDLTRLIEQAYEDDKIIATICHGAAALIGPELDGEALIADREINSFTDEEERKAKKDKIVPFLLESKLVELGATFKKAPPIEGIVVEDLPFISGQNPASAEKVGQAVVKALQAQVKKRAA